jgi:hypothetical protein
MSSSLFFFSRSLFFFSFQNGGISQKFKTPAQPALSAFFLDIEDRESPWPKISYERTATEGGSSQKLISDNRALMSPFFVESYIHAYT